MKKHLHTYSFDGIETMYCQVWLPDEVNGPLPAILFLHGAGERGVDETLLAFQALPKYLTAGREIPAAVICPQCPENIKWKEILPQLGYLLEDILQQYPIDRSHVAITGLSMGGFGTWYAACTWPEKFCRAAAICGAGDPVLAPLVKNIPWRLFHGDADQAVEPAYSEKAYAALQAAGARAELTIYPGVTHNSWDKAYLETDLIDWLIGKENHEKHAR